VSPEAVLQTHGPLEVDGVADAKTSERAARERFAYGVDRKPVLTVGSDRETNAVDRYRVAEPRVFDHGLGVKLELAAVAGAHGPEFFDDAGEHD
jgi:hypothetical protein